MLLVVAISVAAPLPLFCCTTANAHMRMHAAVHACCKKTALTLRPTPATLDPAPTLPADVPRLAPLVAHGRPAAHEPPRDRSSFHAPLETIQLRI